VGPNFTCFEVRVLVKSSVSPTLLTCWLAILWCFGFYAFS